MRDDLIRIERYCRKCGKKMVAKRVSSGKYNEFTGEEVFKIKIACPTAIDTVFSWGHCSDYVHERELTRLQEAHYRRASREPTGNGGR